MRMRALVVLCGLVLMVVAFAATAPASLVDARVRDTTHGRVRLVDTHGTVWQGQGVLAQADGRWRVPVAWTLDAFALVRGALAVTLVPTDTAAARGTIAAEPDTVQLTGVHLDLPAAAIESLWTRPPVPRLDGLVTLDAPSFRAQGRRTDGAFDLQWQRARLSLAGFGASLGTVEAHARPGDGGTVVALQGRGGDILLNGTATWREGRATVDATLTPAATLPPAMAAALRALGRAEPDGSVRVSWQAQP
jgi:hypothetical protein